MRPRTLAVALFVSLAVNLFLAGLFIGDRLDRRGSPAPGPRERGGIGLALATLSPDQQALWRETRRASRDQIRGPMRQARDIRQAAFRRFAEEPFPTAALAAELARARQLEGASRAAMDANLVAFAAGLPLADRARFGAALAAPRQHRPPRHDFFRSSSGSPE